MFSFRVISGKIFIWIIHMTICTITYLFLLNIRNVVVERFLNFLNNCLIIIGLNIGKFVVLLIQNKRT